MVIWVKENELGAFLPLIPDAEVRDEGIRYTLTFEDHGRLRKERFETFA